MTDARWPRRPHKLPGNRCGPSIECSALPRERLASADGDSPDIGVSASAEEPVEDAIWRQRCLTRCATGHYGVHDINDAAALRQAQAAPASSATLHRHRRA